MIIHRKQFYTLGFMLLLAGAMGWAQDPGPAAQGQEQGQTPRGERGRGANDERGPAAFGKITAIHGQAMELTKPDGTSVTVKITGKTEFRRERQNAKLSDFKVGDLVLVRGEESADHSITASLIGGRSAGGPEGGNRGFGGGAGFGELGKDIVVGEVKSVDAPNLTVLRPDNVTQTVELNEETSLRKGRESITMADIQAGDHVVVHGGVQNNHFVPKVVIVVSPEQWKRMHEMGMFSGGRPGNAPPTAPKSNPPQP